jgi:hypothetical protein
MHARGTLHTLLVGEKKTPNVAITRNQSSMERRTVGDAAQLDEKERADVRRISAPQCLEYNVGWGS